MKAASRTLLSTLVLLVLAGGAVAAAWFGIAKKDEAAQARKAAEEKLYAFAPAKVKAMTVEAKGETTSLTRAGEGWRIESPVRAAAERATADAIVDRLAELKRKSSIARAPDAAALARYGLAKPRAKVTLTLDGGKKETLALGDENAFDGTAFVQTTGGDVDLVPGDLRWTVERGTFELRDKRLLPFEEKDLQRVSVVTPRLSYELAREKHGWKLDAPLKERADDTTVSRVLGAIRGLRATAFLEPPQDDRALGLDEPRWKVTLVSPGATRTLAIGEEAGGRPAPGGKTGPHPLHAKLEGSGEVAVLAEGSAKDLGQDLFALRDKSVLHFDRDEVAIARFTVGGSSFEAKKDSAAGRMAGLLWTLWSLKAKAFADESGRALAEHGLDHPAREVALLGKDGKELDHLYVSAGRGGRTFARSASSPRIVEIDGSALESLPRSAQDLAEKPGGSPETAKVGRK
jgi:hypothetical protein